MNACIISYSFYENDFRVRRYAELLADNGNNVDVITLRKFGESAEEIIKGVKIFKIKTRKYNETKLLDYFFNIFSFFIRGMFYLIVKNFKKKYKIIHIHNVPDFLIFMGLIPRLFKSKLILDIHDILPELFCQKFSKSMNSSLAKVLLYIERISVHFADHVIIANDIWRNKIIIRNCLNPNKCSTILNYPSKKLFKKDNTKFNDTKFKIVYPGTISNRHGLDIAVKAIYILRNKIPNIQLDIYGNYSTLKQKKLLEFLIKNLDLNNMIKIHKIYPLEKMGSILSDAKLGLVPKRAGLFTSEAFSTKILELMALGIPIIASKTKIDEYYFNNNMIMFFQPGNYIELANCIKNLYYHEKMRYELIQNSKLFIERNYWEDKKNIYIKIVNTLLA
jgi:glycosyltransferase involved in cell wall biosynthesis